MGCLLSMFLCAECKEPIVDPSSMGQKYCEDCKRTRAVEQRAYHRYLVNMMKRAEHGLLG